MGAIRSWELLTLQKRSRSHRKRAQSRVTWSSASSTFCSTAASSPFLRFFNFRRWPSNSWKTSTQSAELVALAPAQEKRRRPNSCQEAHLVFEAYLVLRVVSPWSCNNLQNSTTRARIIRIRLWDASRPCAKDLSPFLKFLKGDPHPSHIAAPRIAPRRPIGPKPGLLEGRGSPGGLRQHSFAVLLVGHLGPGQQVPGQEPRHSAKEIGWQVKKRKATSKKN